MVYLVAEMHSHVSGEVDPETHDGQNAADFEVVLRDKEAGVAGEDDDHRNQASVLSDAFDPE